MEIRDFVPVRGWETVPTPWNILDYIMTSVRRSKLTSHERDRETLQEDN